MKIEKESQEMQCYGWGLSLSLPKYRLTLFLKKMSNSTHENSAAVKQHYTQSFQAKNTVSQ